MIFPQALALLRQVFIAPDSANLGQKIGISHDRRNYTDCWPQSKPPDLAGHPANVWAAVIAAASTMS